MKLRFGWLPLVLEVASTILVAVVAHQRRQQRTKR